MRQGAAFKMRFGTLGVFCWAKRAFFCYLVILLVALLGWLSDPFKGES